eukprot:g47706.t1
MFQVWTLLQKMDRKFSIKAEYEVLFLQFSGGIVMTLEEAQDGHVVQGVGGGVEVVHDWEVLSFVCFVDHLRSVRDKRQQCLLQCHNNATRKLEEQHLIFC